MPPFKAHEVGHQRSMAKVVKHRCLERRCPSRGVQNAGSDGTTKIPDFRVEHGVVIEHFKPF